MSGNHSWGHLALACCLALVVRGGVAAEAAAPPEVGGLVWCPGSKTCLSWSPAAGAATYRLYSGRLATLPDLLAASPDSCLVSQSAATTTGPLLQDRPEPCSLFWYLVTAQNAEGEGPAGDASAGPRVVNSTGSCLVSCAPVAVSCLNPEDCCSGRCFAGACDEACCREGGGLCSEPGDCCSGVCNAGVCAARIVCPYGLTDCSGACVDVRTDGANCGSCGHACATGQMCVSGSCAPLSAAIQYSIPASPSATTTTFNLVGSAVGVTVSIYSNGSCSGSAAASGPASAFNSAGIPVTIPSNSLMTFYARAADGAGSTSACSAGFTVIHDSVEMTPVITGSNPSSPSRTATMFSLRGTADTGGVAPTTVFLYTNGACGGSPVNSGTAALFGSVGIAVPIAPNSGATFYARGTDMAGNTSGCSTGFTVIHDSVEATPAFIGSNPPSPSSTATTFYLIGTADTGTYVAPTTVRIYSNSACSGSPVNSGTAAVFGSVGIPVTIAPNSSGTFYASAIDTAGNASSCSTGITVTHNPNRPPSGS